MEVRTFQIGDIDAVFAIQRAAYEPLYEKYHDDGLNPYMESRATVLRKYTQADTRGYVFVMDGVPVGAVRIRIDPERQCARVSALAVLPQYQGGGIAQQALLKIEEMHRDIRHWSLDTILQEEGNCHLYEKMGYHRTGNPEPINEKMTLVFYEK